MAVRFLHIADLHLGLRTTRFAPDVAGKLQEARFQALENVGKRASEKPTDFILVCGDLFDDNTVDRSTSERALRLLNSFACGVFVLPGNHDPLCAGSVWDRAPWKDIADDDNVRVLRERSPVSVADGVTLLPCPVRSKTSLSDPFDWIHTNDTQGIRIGVGHGSVMDRPQLPVDDHPIPESTPQDRGLDYVALGHWHGERRFADGCMAYPGTHEQMRFPDTDFVSGWESRSSVQLAEFNGDGFGNALRVEISAHGEKPVVESVPVGHFRWRDTAHEVMNADDFEQVFQNLAEAETPERTLLRVKLRGVLPIAKLAELDGIRSMLNRYVWSDVDQSGLTLTPTDADLSALESQGMSGKVLTRIQEELASEPPQDRRELLEHARLVLYRLNQETAQ
ncbi:MAG: DNA repair exonuclease [Planctomycetes bacterium]|nr:DNA repair exonuclease [Planctomycetota bacterium]